MVTITSHIRNAACAITCRACREHWCDAEKRYCKQCVDIGDAFECIRCMARTANIGRVCVRCLNRVEWDDLGRIVA